MSLVSGALNLLGALAVFLYGMKVMSEALQKVAGARLKRMLHRMTANRFVGGDRSNGQARHHPLDRIGSVADQQADVVPIRGEAAGRELFQEIAHFLHGCHACASKATV